MINRRRFLSLGALALAYQATPFTGLPLVRSLNKLKVLVVGAGPAGLSAAYELQKAGHDVHVFEARDRVGGRIHTLREPFDKGMYAEAGALYLTSNNPGVAYAREFGLKLNEVVFGSDLGTVVYIKGQRLLEYPGQKAPEYPFPLPDSDRGQTISGLQGKYHRAPIYGKEWLGELNRPEYPQPEYAHLDDISLLEFWKQNGASPATIELMKLRYYGSYSDDLDQVSVLQLHREAASFLGMEGGYQIAGGNDRLCSELAKRLANPVQLESPVVMVEQNDREAAVTIRAKGGEMKRFSGDSLIVTIPPQVMGAVDLSSAVSEELIRTFDNIAGVEATRTFIQTGRRFWSDENLDGNAVTDMRMGFMRHTTLTQDSQKGILESFANNANARYLANLPHEERVALVKQQMNLVYPGLTDHAENEVSYCWGDDPWSGANLSSFKPGQITKFHRLLAENAGRVFFAGDTCGGVPGYSHSAFISGQRTAALVNEMGS